MLLCSLIRATVRHHRLAGHHRDADFRQLASNLDLIREHRLLPVGVLASYAVESLVVDGYCHASGLELAVTEALLLLLASPDSPLVSLPEILDEVRIDLDPPEPRWFDWDSSFG